jgi:chromosome segregation ATPase
MDTLANAGTAMYQGPTGRPKLQSGRREGIMQASRTNLIVAALLALLMIVGWVMYASLKSRFDEQTARAEAERTELSGQIEGLTDERAQLTGQVAELERTLAEERAAAGDLASLRERIETASATLNQRMEVLGARERELAEVNTALDQAKQQMAALEERQATNLQRLSARLTTLGQRERDLAETTRSLSGAQLRAQQLQTQIEELANTETEKRAILGALNLELGTLERERAKRATALAGVQGQLQTTQTLLAETKEQLDKALLARSVADLRAREAELQTRLDALNAELAHKGPLLDRSIDVSREIATLDQQLRSLTEQRTGLADELADLMSRIEEPAGGAQRGAQGETGPTPERASVVGN